MRRSKEMLEAFVAVIVAFIILAVVVGVGYSNYTTCIQDGYSHTVCRSMAMSKTVIIEAK